MLLVTGVGHENTHSIRSVNATTLKTKLSNIVALHSISLFIMLDKYMVMFISTDMIVSFVDVFA